MLLYLCVMRVKTPSKPKCVGGRVELSTSICVIHWKSCWCLCPCPNRVYDTNQRQSGHSPVWRTWAGEARCFCGLLSGLNGVCSDLLGSCHVSSSLWPCKPSFCYGGFVSVLLEILQSVTFLWRLRVLDLLLLWLSWFLIVAFLPSVFQAQHIQVGSVYIGNTSGKLEFLSEVGLMTAQVAIFSFWQVSWSGALLSATLLLWDVKWSLWTLQLARVPQEFVQQPAVFDFGCFQNVLFCFLISVCNPEKLHLMSFL